MAIRIRNILQESCSFDRRLSLNRNFAKGPSKMTLEAHVDRKPLLQDRSFWGLNLTQFFGAFNDNLFKQLVMLDCLDQASRVGGKDLQGLGIILFAVPFIAISGYAGYLSDRFSKRTIIVLCKLAEVVIVLLGMIGFLAQSLPFLLTVLCLMGAHSAFFGPSKYGILPEMLRSEDLPGANGLMLMATFLAIIFGLTAAGTVKYLFPGTLWLASLPCLIISIMGLISSLAIRSTPVAQPSLKFDVSSLLVAPATQRLLRDQPTLLGALLTSSLFWFVGSTVYPPAINALGKEQFHLNDLMTGLLAATTGVGIALGCVFAGVLSKDRFQGWMVRMGAWGITLSLLLLAIPGPGWNAVREEVRELKLRAEGQTELKVAADKILDATADTSDRQPINESNRLDREQGLFANSTERFYRGTLLGPYGSALALISVGLFAGFYSVPLQVYLQSAAPLEQKGRIIGANNLINWIGIALGGFVCFLGRILLVDWMSLPCASLFGLAAALMLPVALFYRPPATQMAGPA
jgi:MFS family permease